MEEYWQNGDVGCVPGGGCGCGGACGYRGGCEPKKGGGCAPGGGCGCGGTCDGVCGGLSGGIMIMSSCFPAEWHFVRSWFDFVRVEAS